MHYIAMLFSIFIYLVPMMAQAENKPAGENYFATTYIESKPTNARRIKAAAEPQLFSGVDKKEDYQRMHEKGYELVGYSNFTAGDIAPELALPQARKVGAEMVLLYSEKTGNRQGSVQELKDAKARGEKIRSEDIKDRPMGYSYFATYWAKIMPPVLGVHVLVPKESEKPDGLIVLVVMDGSPAEKAGIKKDDILSKIGDVEVNTIEQLNQAMTKFSGQAVTIEYKRERQFMSTTANLN